MIENDTQLSAALFQMESFADTLEGMRRHAQQAEPSVFAVTSGGFINLLRERIAEAKAYVDSLPDITPLRPPSNGSNGFATHDREPAHPVKTSA